MLSRFPGCRYLLDRLGLCIDDLPTYISNYSIYTSVYCSSFRILNLSVTLLAGNILEGDLRRKIGISTRYEELLFLRDANLNSEPFPK